MIERRRLTIDVEVPEVVSCRDGQARGDGVVHPGTNAIDVGILTVRPAVPLEAVRSGQTPGHPLRGLDAESGGEHVAQRRLTSARNAGGRDRVGVLAVIEGLGEVQCHPGRRIIRHARHQILPIRGVVELAMLRIDLGGEVVAGREPESGLLHLECHAGCELSDEIGVFVRIAQKDVVVELFADRQGWRHSQRAPGRRRVQKIRAHARRQEHAGQLNARHGP